MTALELIKQLLDFPDLNRPVQIYISGNVDVDAGYEADIDHVDPKSGDIIINVNVD